MAGKLTSERAAFASCRYQRRLFHARRPDLLRSSRIPGTLAISTNASSHFILPTIPEIKPFHKNSRQQESKKTIAIGLGASRGGRSISRTRLRGRERIESRACPTRATRPGPEERNYFKQGCYDLRLETDSKI
ncbi:hypothetical protein QYF36_016491 [Acer negundo]|nr:hypothetical protein Q3G72_029132 [Acer saccharum]KAK4838798.1 hypothetical protein QYF36_016491 [Acer negundo]